MIDLTGLDLTDPRCSICLGPAGNDDRRCERPALPLHRLHRVGGVSYLVDNVDEINAALTLAYAIDGITA